MDNMLVNRLIHLRANTETPVLSRPKNQYLNTAFATSMVETAGHWMNMAKQRSVLVSSNTRPMLTLGEKYTVLGFSTSQLVDTLKFFAYIVYAVEYQETPNINQRDVQAWASTTLDLFASLKINVRRPVTQLIRLLPPNHRISDSQYETLFDTVKSIRDVIWKKKTKIDSDPSAITDLRNLFGSIMTYFNSKSESSFGQITRKIGVLRDPKLSAVLRSSEGKVSVEPVIRYQNYLKKITGRKDAQAITTEERKQLSPKQLSQHNQLKKAHDDAWKAKMEDIIRSANEQHLPAPEVVKILKADGFPTWQIPKGFTGRIDERKRLYTKQGVPLASGQAGGTMEMNPDYDPKKDDTYVATGRSLFTKPGAKGQYFYTVNYTDGRSEKKQAKAQDLEDQIEDLQKEWRKDFNNKRSQDRVLAAMLEMLYQTQARIGAAGNQTDGKATFGLATWCVRHVKLAQNGSLIITYLGKSGMVNKHVIKPNDPIKTALIDFIVKLTKNKGRNDPLWTHSNGAKATPADVRGYLKDLGFEGGPHAFRHYKGNQVFNELLKKYRLPKNPTPKQVKDYHTKITTEVGKILGHQRTDKEGKTIPVGSTASKSYISPELQRELFRRNGAPVPKALEKLKQDY